MRDQEEIHLMIKDCLKRKNKLAEEEFWFIQSLNKHFYEMPINQRELEQLEGIWERVT